MTLAVTAQNNVEIAGQCENAAGKRIELYYYEDMLSRAERLMDATQIDDNGQFTLHCYANYPRLVVLQIENYSQSFYIEPGRHYNTYLPHFDWDQDERRNLWLDPVALPFEFLNLAPDELNLRIARFEETVDSFVTANRVWFDLKYHPQKRYMDTLEALVHKRWPAGQSARGDQGGTFFERYVEYTLAVMRLSLHFASRKQLHNRYLAGKSVLYHDENYMTFLFALNEDAISKGTRRVGKNRLIDWVRRADLTAYMDSIGTDPLLFDEQLRELAAIEALKESYYDHDYDRTGVRAMLRTISTSSKFPEHRKLAENLLASFQQAERGTELPVIELPDADHNIHSLDEFRGKWVYLSFVRVGDPNSLRELETMAHFRDSVYSKDSNVLFVSISCDREFQKMYHFLHNSRRGQRYNWLWLHFDRNYRLLERYGVVRYPTFILINPEGKLHYNITPSPESGILLHGPWEKKKTPVEENALPFFQR